MRSSILKVAALALFGCAPLSALALDPGGALGGGVSDAAGEAGGAAKGAADAAGDAVGGAAKGAGEAAGNEVGGAARGAQGAARGASEAAGGAAGNLGGVARGGNPGGALEGALGAAREQSRDVPGAVGSIGAGPGPGGSATGALDPARGGGAASGSRPSPAATRSAPPTVATTQPGVLAAVEEVPIFLRLPPILAPAETSRGGREVERLVRGFGTVRGAERELRQLTRPLSPRAGVPRRALEACRNTIAAGAKPHGAIRVEAVSAGAPRPVRNGVTGAPIEARILYSSGGQVQVRQARITCHVSAQGRVVALI